MPACSANWRGPSSASATCRAIPTRANVGDPTGAIASYRARDRAGRAPCGPRRLATSRRCARSRRRYRQRGDVLALTGDKAKALRRCRGVGNALCAGCRAGRRDARRSRGRGRGRRSSSAISSAIPISRTSDGPAPPTSPMPRRSRRFRQLDQDAPADVARPPLSGRHARAHRHHARGRQAVDRRGDGVSGVVRDSPRSRRARADASRHPARPRHRAREAGQRAAGAVGRGAARWPNSARRWPCSSGSPARIPPT